MIIYRQIEEKLNSWKNDKDKLPLVVRGARQVGKTFVIDKFARENYKNYVYINFELNPSYKEAFDSDLNIENIINILKLKNKDFKFEANNTLIFFDEIQKGGNCRTALKFFATDKRYDVIASGSLLGLYHEDVSSFPVGYVENIELQSLNFVEFLLANGVEQKMIDYIKECFYENKAVDESIHNELLKYFKMYIVIGGMPRAVVKYVETKDITEVDKIKNDILNLYRDDVAKYAKGTDKSKILACFDSIPRHLSKDKKKFKFSEIEQNGSQRKYGSSLEWLYDAGIINFCYNLSRLEIPYEGFVIDNDFKIYMKDTGLLLTMLGTDAEREILTGNLKIYKGAIYENIIGEIFSKSGKKLYYYSRNNTLEIDYIITYKDNVTCVEVKSSENTKSKSLSTILNENIVNMGIKLSTNNVSVGQKIINFPLYMAFCL